MTRLAGSASPVLDAGSTDKHAEICARGGPFDLHGDSSLGAAMALSAQLRGFDAHPSAACVCMGFHAPHWHPESVHMLRQDGRLQAPRTAPGSELVSLANSESLQLGMMNRTIHHGDLDQTRKWENPERTPTSQASSPSYR